MGHITLAAPVAHIWFLKALPSKVGNLLDMTLKELERVLYFEGHIVVDPKDTPLTKGEVLSDEQLHQAREDFGSDFVAGIGAEAIQTMLRDLNVEELSESLRVEMAETKSEAKRKKLTKRLKERLGFNDSALHWDLVNTEKKQVAAHLKGGKTRVIYENGTFTI